MSIAPAGVAEWSLLCDDPSTCSIQASFVSFLEFHILKLENRYEGQVFQEGSTLSLRTLDNWSGEELTVVISPARTSRGSSGSSVM